MTKESTTADSDYIKPMLTFIFFCFPKKVGSLEIFNPDTIGKIFNQMLQSTKKIDTNIPL